MTDVPADNGAPGAPPAQTWDPSGIRRSNFTPPPPDAEPPTFDDDALADAMAAEVSPYTSEIKLPHLLPPEGAEFEDPGHETVAEPAAVPSGAAVPAPAPAPVPVALIPLVEPARFVDSGFPADTAPLSAATGGTTPAAVSSPEEEELRRTLGGASTLEAMDRLEDEFRRISHGEAPSIELPVTAGETPAVEAQPAPVADTVRRVNTDVFSWLSAATVASILDGTEVPAEPVDASVDSPGESTSAPSGSAEEGAPAASVFDIPGAVASTSGPLAEPVADDVHAVEIAAFAEVSDDTVTTQIATVEPSEPAELSELSAPAVDPLAFGGAWALSEAEPELDTVRELPPVPSGPLPGTDALGWNTLAPSPEVAASEATLSELAEPELEPTPVAEPSEPLPSPLGTEVWALFPDEDVVTPPPGPEESVFELPAAAPGSPVADAPADESVPVESVPLESALVESPSVEAPPAATDPQPEPAAFAWMFPASTAVVAPIDEPSFPLPDPGAEGPDGAPVAFESLATAAVPIVVLVTPTEPASDPASAAELAPEPEPAQFASAPESSSFPGLPPVDESLIDPDAAAEAAVATLAASIPPPLPTPTSLVSVEPWMAAEEAEDGIWDLGAAVPATALVADRVLEPEPELARDDASATSLNPAIAAAAAAAALVAAGPPAPAFEPATVSESGTSFESIPAPAPTVLPADAGPQLGVALPYSTEPPVGPESPDWLDAPPPVYTPPELVEPPPLFTDAPPSPAFDEVAPITASTMARLPVPPPSELPNIADRAELPPPPGYEDIPIMSSDAAAQSAAFAPILFAPAMSAPLTPSAEPLLPVPPSAPASESAVEPAVESAVEPAQPDEANGSGSGSVAVPLGLATGGANVAAATARSFIPEATESASLDDEDDDAIDEVDRVGAVSPVAVAGAAGAAAVVAIAAKPSSEPTVGPAAPLSEPIATVRLDDDQPAIVDAKPKVSAIEVESAGVEPTAMDLRTGRAARLFWLWFAANSSVVSLGLGAVLLGTGMSLRQSIVATLAGIAISFLPLGLGTLAGKWSGQPTMVVSRATFGHAGNILPAALAVITRVFWGGVLLWLLATAVAQILVGAGLDAGLGTQLWQLVGMVVGFVIATVVALFGYGFVARLQLVLSIVNALLIVGAAILTFQHLNFTKALTVPDGSWVLAIGGAAIVFSVIGLAWVHSSSDLARYQRPGVSGSGGASMLWATFGATLPPFLLICWGAMLAASDPALARGMQTNPLAAIAGLLPAWYPIPLLAAAALGLLSGAVLTIYSSGFAVLALGLRLRRSMTTLVSAVLVLAAATALLFLVPDFAAVARSLIITIAVPVAAWAGIFAAEMMIRTRRFHTASLLTPGGIYPQVRWLNLIGLVVISAISYGFVTSNVDGFRWAGFAFTAMGVGAADPFGASNVGVFIALLLGVLLPLAGGIGAIRRQEAVVPGAHAEATPVAPPFVTTAPVVTAAPGPFSALATPVSTPAATAASAATPAAAPTRIPTE